MTNHLSPVVGAQALELVPLLFHVAKKLITIFGLNLQVSVLNPTVLLTFLLLTTAVEILASLQFNLPKDFRNAIGIGIILQLLPKS
jgi:hypothetical protein